MFGFLPIRLHLAGCEVNTFLGKYMRRSTNGQYQMTVLVFSRNIIDMEVLAEASLRYESSPKEFVEPSSPTEWRRTLNDEIKENNQPE